MACLSDQKHSESHLDSCDHRQWSPFTGPVVQCKHTAVAVVAGSKQLTGTVSICLILPGAQLLPSVRERAIGNVKRPIEVHDDMCDSAREPPERARQHCRSRSTSSGAISGQQSVIERVCSEHNRRESIDTSACTRWPLAHCVSLTPVWLTRVTFPCVGKCSTVNAPRTAKVGFQ